jgi:cytochrome P450
VQSVRKGEQDFVDFRKIMSDLLHEIKSRGPLKDSDVSVAAHLLRIVDPSTGKPLPDDRIAAEIGVLFTGGFETTGHTIAWAMLTSPHSFPSTPTLLSLAVMYLMLNY